MNNHIKLGLALVVLLAAALLLMFTQGANETGTPLPDTHDDEGRNLGEAATEAGHGHEGGSEAQQNTQANKGEEQVAQAKANDRAAFVPKMPAAKGKRTRARIETSMGAIEVILFDDLTPATVKNFLDLTKKGFYKNMIFHRVIKDFMIQTGDPMGTGRGGPGYKFDSEVVPDLRHSQPGVLAMANSGPNTNGSQFYITARATPHLDGGYSIFGQVVKGMDVVMAIDSVKTSPEDRPLAPVEFREVVILGQE